jgi:hypothetical protein
MCRIRIVGPRQIPLKNIKEYYSKPNFVNVTSRTSEPWSRALSPFYAGPCEMHGGKYVSNFMENAWQFSKVFPGYAKLSLSFFIVRNDIYFSRCRRYEDKATGNPSDKYWEWAKKGWESPKPIRFPMGKGKKPLYCWYNNQKLGCTRIV